MHRPWIPKYVSWGLWSQLLVPDHDQPHGTLLNTLHFGGQSLCEITMAFFNNIFLRIRAVWIDWKLWESCKGISDLET